MPIQSIIIDWRYLEPQNLLLIVLILATIVTSSLLVYILQRRNIPKLVFDGLCKDKGVPTALIYFLKIKREKGEGRAQGVQGFVGVKDKFEPKRSELLLKTFEIFLYDYLPLFKVFEYNVVPVCLLAVCSCLDIV